MGLDAIKAGRTVVEIGGDDSPLRNVLRQVQKRIAAAGEAIRNIGFATLGSGLSMLGPLGGASMLFASMGDELSNMSDRTGIAVQTLDELRFAAMQSGASAEELEGGFRKMGDFLGSAMTPDKLALLESLGLKFDDLQKMTPDEAFLAFSDAISKIEDPFTRTSTAMDIFGKAGTKLLPMMKDGAAGIRALQEQFRPFAMTEAEARAGDEYGDKIDEIKAILKNTVAIIGSAVAPVITELIDLFKEVLTPIIGWVRENKVLFGWLTKIALGVTAVGGVLIAVGSAFSVVAFAVGGLATVLPIIGVALLAIAGIAMQFGVPFLVLWGVLELLGTSFGEFFDTLGELWNTITEGVDWLDVLTVALIGVGAVVATLAAFTVVPLLVTLSPLLIVLAAVAGAVYLIIEYWDEIKEAVSQIIDIHVEMFMTLKQAVSDVFSWIMGLVPGVTEVLGEIWSGMVDSVASAFASVKGVVASGVETVGAMIGDLTSAFGGIGDAMAIGDWAAAFEIGWLAVQLVFQRGKNWILAQWSDLKFNVLSMWDALVQALAPVLQPVIVGLITLFFDLAQAIGNIINRIVALLPESAVPAALRRPITFSEQRARALESVSGAFAAGQARTREVVDTTEQERLERELAAANADAAQARFDDEQMRLAVAESEADWARVFSGRNSAAGLPAAALATAGATMASFSAGQLSQFGASSEAERTANGVEALVAELIPGVRRVGDILEGDEGGVRVS